MPKSAWMASTNSVYVPAFLPSRCASYGGSDARPRESRQRADFCSQYYQETPDYTVSSVSTALNASLDLTTTQDSDTNPNTTASSVAGDAPADGRKRRTDAHNMRKTIYGKKHDRLGASKVRCQLARPNLYVIPAKCMAHTGR